jgi:excisionase family DNA binding protein
VVEAVTDSPYVDIDAAAAYLGVCDDTVRKLMQTRGLPAFKLGPLVRFKLDEIDEWAVRECRVEVREQPTQLPRRARAANVTELPRRPKANTR